MDNCIGSQKMVLCSEHGNKCIVNAYCLEFSTLKKLECKIGKMVLKEELESKLCSNEYKNVDEYILCPRCKLSCSYTDLIACIFELTRKALSARVCDYSDDEGEDVL